jgi:hypothetical protein
MPDECKIGIEVNPKGRAGKADYSWHQPVSGESAIGRVMTPARQANFLASFRSSVSNPSVNQP